MGNFMVFFGLWFCITLCGLHGQQYSTRIDAQLAAPLRVIRKYIANLTAEQSEMNKIYHINKKLGKIQPHMPPQKRFYCDAKNGPGRRSSKPPESVDEIRPGDIDIIAAIGDSLTAANGAISNDLYSLFNENRGISFATGGRGDWRKYLTLANILREFNEDLYGYSTEDSFTTDRASKFNVAEPTARFEDMLFQSKVLFKRLQRDPKVNMTSNWKLITVFFGSNDICGTLCNYKNPEDLIKKHEESTLNALRFLRDNVPRAIINWILLPNLVKLTGFKNIPMQCYIAERIECPCIYSSQATPEKLKRYANIVTRIQNDQKKILYQDEFHTDTFTVNLQSFTRNYSLPELSSGGTDLRYFASDCFHFSQLGQAAAANALWNNMIQPEGAKQGNWMPAFKHFQCPTDEHPFIATRGNSK